MNGLKAFSVLKDGATSRSSGFAASGILRTFVIAAVVIGLGAFLPVALKSNFYLGLLISAIVLGISAVSIGFLAHQCGLVVFGAAGFSGGASYLFGIAVMQFGWSVTTAVAFAVVASTLLSALVGALIVRARPLQFAMLTLALAQMVNSLVKITDYRDVTGGDDGFRIDFSGTFFGLNQAQLAKPETFWPVAWLALCGVVVLAWFVGRSRLGQVLRAIRANEERMRFSGFNTFAPRLFAFTLAGFIASVSGVLAGLNTAFVSPELLDFVTGGNALVAMLIGGPSSATGPVLGALLYVIGQDQFGSSGHLELLTGIAVVLAIVVFPQGAMGFILKLSGKLRRRNSKAIGGPEDAAH